MQEQANEIRRAMRPVAEAFEVLQVPYAVVGSVAGLTHGYSRFTQDVDVVAFLAEDVVAEFVSRLDADYYVDEITIRDAIRHCKSFNLICNENGYKIDVFVPEPTDWQKQLLARCEPEQMADVGNDPAFVIQSAEDLVLSKLCWFRMAGETSERQWEDVLGVLKMGCFDLDIKYLERWARELNVSDLLDKALDESGVVKKS